MKNGILGIIVLWIVAFPVFAQSGVLVKGDTKKVATTEAEYIFMLEDDLDLGRQQQYSGINTYNDYIGEYVFRSIDIIKDLESRYVGTVITITDKHGKKEVVCIPYLNKTLMKAHQEHLNKILKNNRLAKAYTEFIARKAAFSSALEYKKI